LKFRLLMVVATLAVCVVSVASAQTPTAGSTADYVTAHRGELIPLGGYAWTMGFDVYTGISYGEIDLKDAGFLGVALDVNTQKNGSGKTGQIRFLYRRSNTTAQFRAAALAQPIESDVSVEYWHVGGLAGVPRGNVMPYATFTVGGTRLIAGDEDAWKFSTMLGLGVKVYKSPKVGLMIQGTWPFTFMETWGGVAVGSGGAAVSLGGTGISQLDVGGGLIVTF
jgi:hypothetical protein